MSEPTLPTASGAAAAHPVCPRHPDRESYVTCQRCRRPVCPECQRPAPVGVQCVDCVRDAARAARPTRTVFGLCVAMYAVQLLRPATTAALDFSPLEGWAEPWRAVTAAFLHLPEMPLHLGVNMLVLWQIGPYLEGLLGRARFLALYLISAIGGSAGVLLLAPTPRTIVRTSAEAAEYAGWATPVLNRSLGRSSGAMYAVVAINMAFGFFYPGISWQGHLGGLITGVAVAGVFALLAHGTRRRWQWPGAALVLIVIVGVMVVDYLSVPALYR